MPLTVHLSTPRLTLRTVTLEDIPEVARSMNLDGPPLSLEEAESEVRWMLENHRQGEPGSIIHLCLAIQPRDSDEIIGWCGLDQRDRSRDCPVLFYLLKQRFWGQGLATEAASALFDYAFRELNLPRIDSSCAFDNIASKRVMEKLGMCYLGLDEEGGHTFTLARAEYRLA